MSGTNPWRRAAVAVAQSGSMAMVVTVIAAMPGLAAGEGPRPGAPLSLLPPPEVLVAGERPARLQEHQRPIRRNIALPPPRPDDLEAASMVARAPGEAEKAVTAAVPSADPAPGGLFALLFERPTRADSPERPANSLGFAAEITPSAMDAAAQPTPPVTPRAAAPVEASGVRAAIPVASLTLPPPPRPFAPSRDMGIDQPPPGFEDRADGSRTRIASLGGVLGLPKLDWGRFSLTPPGLRTSEQPVPNMPGVFAPPEARFQCLPAGLKQVLVDAAERFGHVAILNAQRRRGTGARASLHYQCRAVDFRIRGAPAHEVMAFLRNHSQVGGRKRYPLGFYHIDDGPVRSW